MGGNDTAPETAEPLTTLIGVGVGPGALETLTYQAADVLAAADIVFAPVIAPEETGRAEQVVLSVVEAWRVEQVLFAHDRPHVEGPPAAAVDQVVSWLAAHPGATAAFATLGDPCLHSSFPAFARAVRGRLPEVAVQFVPGITPMQAVAARCGIPIVEPGQSLAILGGPPDPHLLREVLIRFDGVVAERVGPHICLALDALAAAGRLAGAVLGGCPATRFASARPAASGTADAALPYLTTLIVPPDGRCE